MSICTCFGLEQFLQVIVKLWLEVGVIVGSIQLSIICVKKSYKSVSKLANAANAANAFMLRKNHGSLN